MSKMKFNLVEDPWIKVLDKKTTEIKKLTLIEVFTNTSRYSRLSGEMCSQDLAVMRFLLAILTTVYLRFDIDGNAYPWLDKKEHFFVEPNKEFEKLRGNKWKKDILLTWKKLYDQGQFSNVVVQYLKENKELFDIFGSNPFYQVTKEEYNKLVEDKKRLTDKKQPGSVSLKQINRRISESGNSQAIFSPRTESTKNELSLDELVRWLIMYQNYAGTTDKSKIKDKEKVSVSAGWLYKINPVYLDGNDLFETLMLNLVLLGNDKDFYLPKPIWEWKNVEEYVDSLRTRICPKNIPEIYTNLSRLIYIDWNDNNHPKIYSAGLPMFNALNAFIEPMATWKIDKKSGGYLPIRRGLNTLGKEMWQNFGLYVKINQNDSDHKPGIVKWANELKRNGFLERDEILSMKMVDLIDDGNASSQMPAAEIIDDLTLNLDVVFDDSDKFYWPERIEQVIQDTQAIGNDIYYLGKDIGSLRKVANPQEYADKLRGNFYLRINIPFKKWLTSLSIEDDRDEKIIIWRTELEKIIEEYEGNILSNISKKDIIGIKDGDGNIINIFTEFNKFKNKVYKHLKKEVL